MIELRLCNVFSIIFIAYLLKKQMLLAPHKNFESTKHNFL